MPPGYRTRLTAYSPDLQHRDAGRVVARRRAGSIPLGKPTICCDIGVDDHVHCALGRAPKAERAEGLGTRFAPMLQPVVVAAGADYTVVSAHRCSVSGRTYFHIILQRGQTPVSVILTPRDDPRRFSREPSRPGCIRGSRGGFSVAAFQTGAYLAYIVSALPGQQNGELAGRLVPVIDRYAAAP